MTIAATQAPLDMTAIAREWFRREPRFAAAAVVFAALALPTLVAMALDGRTHQDINIWIKPLKFTVSIVVYLGTLAWFAGWLRWETTQKRWFRRFSIIVVVASVLEILWVYGAAANGIASHYNREGVMAALYGVAGIVVMIVMTAAPVYAWGIAKNPRLMLSPVFRASVIQGLWLTFILTVIMASVLSAQPNHWVGGNASDAEGSLVFGWARDGGDLRAAHFFSLHAMHFIPAAGLLMAMAEQPRRMAAAASALFTAFTIYVFVEALMGRPFLFGLL
ncbi:MAG: hypothetical protein AAF401_07995 [Pseudomonadota bacterium]